MDTQNYPTLATTVTVWDPVTGMPMASLNAANFTATIDGNAAVISQVVPLTTDSAGPLDVVFLVDNSVPDDGSLEKVLSAVGNFVDTLTTADQAALMTVADKPQLAVPFTSDQAQLHTGLAHVTRVVSKTSLHQGIVQAAQLFNSKPGAETRLILVFTNTGDMPLTPVPTATVVQQAQAVSAAVSLLDYTGVDTAKTQAAIAAQTGGHYYALPSADLVDATLKTLAGQLRQGYQITFTSALAGDGAQHTAALTLTATGVTATAQQSFKAPQAEMKINGPGLTDGQTAIGIVQLTTTAVAPVPPITAVEYQLDGRTLATLSQSPYTFQWDSTSVNPGEHQLAVIVHDSGGNSGQVKVRVSVALPFAVTASTDRGQVNIGDKVTLHAQVNSPARIDHVEFWLGDQTLLASVSTPPYECTFDSQGQSIGQQSFRVRAVDYLGRTAETDVFHIDFRPTVSSSAPLVGHWLLLVAVAVGVIAALAAALFGSLALSARLKRGLHSIFQLDIINEGNLRNRYALRAEDTQAALSFAFQVEGAALPVQTILVTPPPAAEPAASVSVANQPAPEGVAPAAPPPAEGPAISDIKKTGAYQSFAKTSSLSATIGSFITTIASLLPGSAGASLRETATTLQAGESVGYSIDQADTQVKAVQHSASTTSAAIGMSASQPSAASSPAVPSTAQPARPGPAPAAAKASPAKSEAWALTPFVEAGEKLAVQLLTRPLKSTRTQRYGIRITSRIVDVAEVASVAEAGQVTVRGLSWFQRLQPFLLAGFFLAVATGLTVLLVHLWGG